MKIEVRDSRLHQVIANGAELEQVVTGFQFLEGPIWHPYDHHLTFSDILGDTLYRWSQREGVTTFRKPSHMANGNTYDREGRILTCEHATSRVTRTDTEGNYEILATHFEGRELNSPNDIVVKSDGSIYFTDPVYGRTLPWGTLRDPELPFEGVYRLDPVDKTLTLLVDDFAGPNGLCFSRDERQLFVDDTELQHIRVFDAQEDGTLANGRIWAETLGEGDGVPDGIKVDQADHLFVTGPGGLHIFDAGANCLGVILTPEGVANFAWGDDDLCSLYLTACTSLYRLRVKVPGLKLF
jgi:gluconolactonase